MPNKYKIFTSNASEESTYQDLVYPRNLACVKQGATAYVVVDSKLVKSEKKVKDCPLFYDDTEFYVMNDDSGKDTWGGVTTTGIYTFDTLITPEKQLVINQTKKEAEQLKEVIDEIDNPPTPSFNITNVYFKLSGQDAVLTAIGDNLPQNAKYSWNIHPVNYGKIEPKVIESDGPILTILNSKYDGYPSQIRDYLNQTAVTITVNGKIFTDIALETQPINIIYSAKETSYTFNTSDIDDDGSEGWWWSFRLYADEDSKEPVAAASASTQEGATYCSAIVDVNNGQEEFINAANANPEYIIVVDISSQNDFHADGIVCHKES